MYNKLLQVISRIEEIDGTPLFTCGIFFNTSRDAQWNIDCIDAESVGIDGKQDYIYNDSQLIEFLNDCGIDNISSFEAQLDIVAMEQDKEIRKRLFNVMSQDIGVMSEHGDSDIDLWNEIESADNEIINAYIDTYLKED